MRNIRMMIGISPVVLLVVGGCATNPVTGERELALISESQEIAMGREAVPQVEASIGLVNDPALQAYVRGIGQALAAQSERPNLPWSFGVLDDPTPNAFALPGGPVYITRGLLSLMDSEAELAAVLGHEIGHITARHSVSQMSRAQLAQLGLGLGMILVPSLQGLGNVFGTGMQLLFLKYGRDDERQADDLGFKYALAKSYDVREMDDVFAALQQVGQQSQSALPSWLSTHPAPEERIARIQQRVAALPALPASPVLNRAELLGRLNGLVYGPNPRQGFFRDGVFLHPDLRFRISFPNGWKTQNLTQAVLAGSPQQDAVIQLTIAQGSPTDAASRFFQQQGIQAGQVTRETVNGLSAVTGLFQAQTQQGTLGGRATFIAYGGNTYQILGYSSAARMQAYDATFRSVMGSFGQLNDPQALNVQPNKIRIERLSTPMSLAEFNRRSPSVIPIAELAVINQVTDPNANLPAGTAVKRVTS